MTFAEALHAHGLLPLRAPTPDGKWHRCPTVDKPRRRNGSFKLASDSLVGWYVNYGVDMHPLTWRPDRAEAPESYDPAWLRTAQAQARAEQESARREAHAYYEKAKPLVGVHAYLQSHALDMRGAFGLRVDAKGWLVVPAWRDGLSTIQRISPEGDKRFWPGASVKGASYVIGEKNASLTVICEGLATGMAIYAAIGRCRVIVAFNSGNLSKITIGDGLAVIASDNDWETEARLGTNPGVIAARRAAEGLQCGVAVPDGVEGVPGASDFCDYRNERVAVRLEMRRPKERETDIRRAVDAELAMQIRREAVFAVRTSK